MAVTAIHLHSPVGSLVSQPARHVSTEESLAAVSRILSAENLSAVLVGAGHGAIVTERDLARAFALECSADANVAGIATPLPISVDASMEIVDAAALMLNQDVRHLIVELPDGSSGIVSLRGVLAVLLQAAQPELWLSSLRVKLVVPSSEAWLG